MKLYPIRDQFVNLNQITRIYFFTTNIENRPPNQKDYLVANIRLSDGSHWQLTYEEAEKFEQYIKKFKVK